MAVIVLLGLAKLHSGADGFDKAQYVQRGELIRRRLSSASRLHVRCRRFQDNSSIGPHPDLGRGKQEVGDGDGEMRLT